MVERPFKPFNDAVENIKTEPQNQKPDLDQLRDKDNADSRYPPPRFTPFGENNRAPKGMSGIKRDLLTTENRRDSDIDITRGDPDKGQWTHGKLTDGSGYHFTAKINNFPSRNGIDGGKIEKLALRHENGYVAAFYDKGWLAKPETWRDQQAVTKIQDVFDGKDKEFTPIVPKSNDKDKGYER